MRTKVAPGRAARLYAAGLALVCAASLLVAPTASADTADDKKAADRQVAALAQALEDTSAELAAAYLALAETQALMPAARNRLAVAEAASRAAARRNAEVGAALAVAEANVARAQEKLDRNMTTRDETQRTLDAFAADMFQGGSVGQLSVALGATSADDFATRLVLADTVTALTNQALNDLATAKADGDATRAYLDAVQVEVTALKRQAEATLAAAKTAEADAAAAKASLDALVAKQSGFAAEVESRKAAEQAQLAEAEAEQQRLQVLLIEQARIAREEEAKRKAAAEAAKRAGKPSPAGSTTDRPSTGAGYLDVPVRGARISSEYGMRYHPILHYYRLHSGMDFAVACGTPVYAAAPGRVIRAGWRGGYGNSIVIDHGIQRDVDLVTTYNHLTSIVAFGGAVGRGQLIGYSGTTGLSTGCHLHFETLEDGSFVNPRTWL
ncbi:MAG: M23 family metallopeptidase [Actinomycetales bacterium]|nr:M23 family metallopeptidase [Candidatus Phosphoribacter baldrii]